MNNALTQPLPPTPPGLQALYETCKKVYPDQGNPLQVTAVLKFWLGGPDPLDYISMYANPGSPDLSIPPHWHYVSFGLSDLHGDGRVHQTNDNRCGFGFEMTFRLKREEEETAPPTWPAKLLQTLARYVFQSGNTLCAGDYASWHYALDNSESSIRHMLMAEDPQLTATQTPFGVVNFVQIVGVCAEEVKAAQQWSVPGVLNILKRLRGVGGEWLVTDMRRSKIMQELDPQCRSEIEHGIRMEGSNLSGVSTRYLKTGPIVFSDSGEILNRLSTEQTDMYQSQQSKNPPSFDHQRNVLHQQGSSLNITPQDNSLSIFDSLHLCLDAEAGSLLSLALRGRVLHGRHFTFNAILDNQVVTLVAPSVAGIFVESKNPYVRHGPWTQIYIPSDFATEMAATLDVLTSSELTLPTTFHWEKRKLAITIECDEYIDGMKPPSPL
uniref:Suppressor of fused homolog n=3 Tax=Cacopsylla melanoneura TaxID=428564 RepID=A0A8D8LWK1_9HEMI